ncbi:hypothetical protein ACHAWF_015018 [Thalassiosira exigua]
MVAAGQPSLLIDYNWHHAVNDQSRLDRALAFVGERGSNGTGGKDLVEAIEADIIYSDSRSRAVMGHPPSVDGDLTLSSFLRQVRDARFQISDAGDDDERTERPVLKLDFKSMAALRSGVDDVKSYLDRLLPEHRRRVWINADILPGPGEGSNDEAARRKVRPRFDAAEFLSVVASEFPGTVLSIGWTTSLTDVRAPYTDDMVDEMISFARDHSEVTFPIRASCFRVSWRAVQKLYRENDNWTVTLWWSHELSKDDFDWIYKTLEEDGALKNRTYYDVSGFREYLLNVRGI